MNDKTKELLTFEVTEDGDEIDIHFNDAGLELLQMALCRVAHSKSKVVHSQNHEHLMSDEWGGQELSSEKQGQDSTLFHKVNLRYWP